MEKIIQKLKKLREIEPDAGFSLKTRGIILKEKPKGGFNLYPLAGVIFAGLVATTIIGLRTGGVSQRENALANELNPERLRAEALALSIDIRLAEIEYYQNLERAITLALGEIKSINGGGPGVKQRTEEINALLEKLF